MTSSKKDKLLLIGRVLIAAIFLFSAYSKFRDMPQTVAYMQTAGLGGGLTLAWIAALIELAGGLMLLLGFHATVAAIGLIAYLVIVTYFFHFELGEGNQTFHLLKNLAIIGGLFTTLASGSGKHVVKKCKCCS